MAKRCIVFKRQPSRVGKHGLLFGQNKLSQFGGLESVHGAVVFDSDRFLAIKKIVALQAGL